MTYLKLKLLVIQFVNWAVSLIIQGLGWLILAIGRAWLGWLHTQIELHKDDTSSQDTQP